MMAGDLYHRVAFDAPLNTPDGHGGTEVGWNTANAVEARANFRFLRGGETVQAARLQGRQPVVVTIRNSAAARAIGSGWRMRDLNGSAVYNVRTGPVPSDDRQWLEITVETGVAV